MTFSTEAAAGVCRLHSEATARWLSSGWNGGFVDAPAAYNVSVPEGWSEVDLAAYGAERRARAGFAEDGPTLFTGVDLRHARGARAGSVLVVATAGVSNPATLPMDSDRTDESGGADDAHGRFGTVNVLCATTEPLSDGALATLLVTVTEAKTATVLAETGFTGTTTDAVTVGCLPDDEPTRFAGSATSVGEATRVCVRDAVRASLRSRYADGEPPASVDAAPYGVVTDGRAEIFVI